MKYLYLLLFCGALATCQQAEPIGAAQPYFPSSTTLKQGIANKYYVHYKSKDSYDTRTNITYTLYQSDGTGQLKRTELNAGFDVEQIDQYSFEGSKMILNERQSINWLGDTIDVKIGPAIHSDWQEDTATIIRMEQWEWGSRTATSQQLSNQNTIILGKPAKQFMGTFKVTALMEEEEEPREHNYEYKKTYVEGIGLFAYEHQSEDATLRMELVEQIPYVTFTKLANHGIQRVAYIDPNEVLDKSSDFQLCDKISKIADYYNGTPDAGFDGGKGALKRQLLPKIDTTKLGKESGYLTFRFVINCKGELGWFKTEQAGLDFQEKEFPKELIQYLYEIIAELDTWHPTIIQEEAQDAYVYLTIKLKDGAIIDFLP